MNDIREMLVFTSYTDVPEADAFAWALWCWCSCNIKYY